MNKTISINGLYVIKEKVEETEAKEAKSIGDRALAESDKYQSEVEAAGADMTEAASKWPASIPKPT